MSPYATTHSRSLDGEAGESHNTQGKHEWARENFGLRGFGFIGPEE